MHPTVEQHVASFRHYLHHEVNLYLETEYGEDGTPFFAFNEKTDQGANVRIVAAFTPNYPSVDIYCFNLADITNPLKREIALKHMNELNFKYRYAKFLMNDEGSVQIQTALDFGEETGFDPGVVFRHMQSLYRASDEEYRTFMKINWA